MMVHLPFNDGVDDDTYIDGSVRITLPTVDFMEARLLSLGRGAYMYKTDLARGYRQLRVDPGDWPILRFQHQGEIFLDVCPPLALSLLLCACRGPRMPSLLYTPRGGTVHDHTSTTLEEPRQLREAQKCATDAAGRNERTGDTGGATQDMPASPNHGVVRHIV